MAHQLQPQFGINDGQVYILTSDNSQQFVILTQVRKGVAFGSVTYDAVELDTNTTISDIKHSDLRKTKFYYKAYINDLFKQIHQKVSQLTLKDTQIDELKNMLDKLSITHDTTKSHLYNYTKQESKENTTHDVGPNLEPSTANKRESKVDASSNDDHDETKNKCQPAQEEKPPNTMYTPSGEFIRTAPSCWSAADADDGFALPITELCVKLDYSANDLFQIYKKYNFDGGKTLQYLKELELKKNSETTIPG